MAGKQSRLTVCGILRVDALGEHVDADGRRAARIPERQAQRLIRELLPDVPERVRRSTRLYRSVSAHIDKGSTRALCAGTDLVRNDKGGYTLVRQDSGPFAGTKRRKRRK